ncbi:hypothetical protein BGZ83_000977 [Gryganskiella cystojenkinii]|nr:hypothetical protein BGZ83_000977 [Gryganskiella cystojenkinii]
MTFCDDEGWIVFSDRRAMDFSLCFQDSIIIVVPSVVLLAALTPRLHIVLTKGRLQGVKTGLIFPLKMLLVLAGIGLQIGFLIELTKATSYPSSSLLSSVFYIVALLAAAVLHYFEHFNMFHPSSTLLIFWLFTTLFSIFPTRAWIQDSPDHLHDPKALLKLLFSIVSFFVFALENVPKANQKFLTRPNAPSVVQANPSPEPWSNFFTRVTFFWLLPLLRLGKKKTLKMDDIWNLHPKLLSYPLYLSTKAKMETDEALAIQKHKDEQLKDPHLRKPKGHINLIAAVAYTVGWSFTAAIVPRLFYVASMYIRPILFSNLIGFMTSYTAHSKVPEEPWVGFGLLIAVMSSAVFASLFDGQFRHSCFHSGLMARSVFVNLIYRKALRLSSTNKQEGMGSIVNHMSTDVDKIVALFSVIHYFWSSIIEVIIIISLLYLQVRYAIFASLAVVILVIGVSVLCSPQIGKYQKAMMQSSDKRMALISELVNAMKAIKLYGWERFFSDKITFIRQEQLDRLRKFYGWVVIVAVPMNSIPPFSIFATLSAYTLIATAEDPLDLQRIFTTITLINMLEGPVNQVSNSLSSVIAGKVCFDRLSEFLNSEEIDDENVRRAADPEESEIAYEIQNGTFGWYTPEAIQAHLEKRKKEAEEKAKENAKKANKAKKETKKSETPSSSSPAEAATLPDEKEGHRTTNDSNDDKDSDEKDLTILEASKQPLAEEKRDSTGPVLHDINLQIKRGSLTAVVGRVGEGKSSLVGALLGEMHKYKGSVKSYGSLAFVAQTAWIMNDTVRNNILFGHPYDKERYLNTVQSCALAADFKMLIDGDKTVIGEKGINLSGGQKQRISIARAVYANADIYIFDDPLSAVDAHVDQHIFTHAISTILANKTRILVTNGVNHLPDVDQIVVIKAGMIVQDGPYADLIQNEQGDLYRLIQESKAMAKKSEEEEEEAMKGEEYPEDEDIEDTDEKIEVEEAEEEVTEDILVQEAKTGLSKKEKASLRPAAPTKRPTFKHGKSSHIPLHEDVIELDETNEVDDEVVSKGSVGWKVYKFYIASLGAVNLVLYGLVNASFLAVEMNAQLWLEKWGSQDSLPIEKQHSNGYWIVTYFAWIISSTFMMSFVFSNSLMNMANRASVKLHSAMLLPMMRSPMSFFDVTSSGKIVNRFAHDIAAVDMDLPLQFMNFTFIVMSMIMLFGFCIAATPYFILVMIPLAFGYYFLAGFFLVSSRELKRLDSAARSPMYAHFSETLSGLVTIRAYSEVDRFAVQATTMLDRSLQTSYLASTTNRWLAIMLDMMSVVVLCMISLLAILQRNSVSAGVYSIVLSQIGGLTETMSRFLTVICQLETDIVSIERVHEYSELPSEARDIIPDSKTPESWPQQGQIVFEQYSTRYREGLAPVLKEIDFTVPAGSRVGIVGRTGAGKSSVTMALFRIIEATGGSISIDGIDISTVGLTELRSRLTIIPQDPFLFGDTIRTNMDPFNKYTDAEIWTALESSSLKGYVSTLAGGLSATIDNGGESMSLGQRQLMSLARAMLAKNTRVLCLDEATAAIDIETDNAIQRALRKNFQGCTVLTIAHRINTIMDSDRILVLDHGRVAEYDTPESLLQNKESIFYSLAAKSGNA